MLSVGPGAGCAQGAWPAPRAADAAPAPLPPGDDERVRWLVTFTEPSVAAQFAGTAATADTGTGTGTEGSRQDRMRAYADALRNARQPLLEGVRSLGGVVLSTMEYSANAAIVEGPAGRATALLDALRKMPGVRSVQPTGVYRADPGHPGNPQAPPTR